MRFRRKEFMCKDCMYYYAVRKHGKFITGYCMRDRKEVSPVMRACKNFCRKLQGVPLG